MRVPEDFEVKVPLGADEACSGLYRNMVARPCPLEVVASRGQGQLRCCTLEVVAFKVQGPQGFRTCIQ